MYRIRYRFHGCIDPMEAPQVLDLLLAGRTIYSDRDGVLVLDRVVAS